MRFEANDVNDCKDGRSDDDAKMTTTTGSALPLFFFR
jgi:hypothetical protein